MNRYYIKIITGVQSYVEHVVEADGLSWSDAGLYEFIKFENGNRYPVAYFPVSKTIIEKIERNIDNK